MSEKIRLDPKGVFFWVQVAYVVELESHLFVLPIQVYWTPSAWLRSPPITRH